jgi:tRNA modification GTPase
VRAFWPDIPGVAISLLTGQGLPALEEALTSLLLAGHASSDSPTLVTSARHQALLQRTSGHLQAAWSALEQGLPLDFVSIDLDAAYEALGEVTGETAREDLLDRIFSEFCIGK